MIHKYITITGILIYYSTRRDSERGVREQRQRREEAESKIGTKVGVCA